MQKLKQLRLNDNLLTGPLPNFGLFPKLSYANFGDNKLNGTIPQSLGNVNAQHNLHHLFLYNNQLTGTIPSLNGTFLPRLGDLYLHDNQLTGRIPSSLGSLPLLSAISCSDNHLSG